MAMMLSNFAKLKYFDLSNFNTTSVTNIYGI